MSLSGDIREKVRERACLRCEFCGVTETDAGGELTIDHFRPVSRGGDDSSDNLIYCCVRCNQYKLDYWPESDGDIMLWNPRLENSDCHFLELDDGRLYPLSETGSLTLRRLRLNRPPLVAGRLRRRRETDKARLLRQYQSLTETLEHLLSQHADLVKEQQGLLKRQQRLIKLLLGI